MEKTKRKNMHTAIHLRRSINCGFHELNLDEKYINGMFGFHQRRTNALIIHANDSTLSMTQVAKMVGTSVSSISKWYFQDAEALVLIAKYKKYQVGYIEQ